MYVLKFLLNFFVDYVLHAKRIGTCCECFLEWRPAWAKEIAKRLNNASEWMECANVFHIFCELLGHTLNFRLDKFGINENQTFFFFNMRQRRMDHNSQKSQVHQKNLFVQQSKWANEFIINFGSSSRREYVMVKICRIFHLNFHARIWWLCGVSKFYFYSRGNVNFQLKV